MPRRPRRPHSREYAQKLIRTLPDDPEAVLGRRSYLDQEFFRQFIASVEARKFEDPAAALPWARMAPRLAHAIPEGSGPEGKREQRERVLKAHVTLAGVLRALARFGEADSRYEKALAVAAQGVSAPALAELYIWVAVLRSAQKRFKEAHRLVKEARKLYKSADDSRGVGIAHFARGYVFNEEKRFTEAVPWHGKAIKTLSKIYRDDETERLYQSATHNMAYAVSQKVSPEALGRASAYMAEARELIREEKRYAPRYHFAWIEALALFKLGSDRLAERRLRRALKGFAVLGMPFEHALCSLDLGAYLHREQRWEALEELAADTFARFQALEDADAEALAALKLWLDATAARELTDEVLEDVKRTVERRAARRPTGKGRR